MLSRTLAAAALAAIAVAAPMPASTFETRSTNATGFTVKQVESNNLKLLNGPGEVFQTYMKYTGTAPQGVYKAASVFAAVQSGSVTANPQQYDSEYLCPVTVGTPGVTLNLDFDTGSSDLWVFSTLLPSADQSGHTLYNPTSSSSASEKSGETWKISYGDGSGASGVVYSDTVSIGGISATMSVEAANAVSSAFVSNTNDGLVGLAWDNINTCTPSACKTWMDTISSSLPDAVFTADLKKGAAGTYDFGFIDSSKYTGSITYVPVNTANGFWEFTAGGYSIGSGSVTGGSFDAIADTGTTLIYLPQAAVTAYYKQVSGSAQADGMYTVPCSATLPDLGISIGGKVFTVPGSYINWSPYTGSSCFGGLQVSSSGQPNILGDVFLKSQFVIFDYGNKQLGVAAQSS